MDAERYSDDAAVLAANEGHLVQILVKQDVAAPRFRVRHVPTQEEYPFLYFMDLEKPRTRMITDGEYQQPKRRTLTQGIWILGSHVSRIRVRSLSES